jgi:hypothetical protein
MFERNREIARKIRSQNQPPIGHVDGYTLEPVDGATLATSYYDWSNIDPVWKERNIFPIISEGALRANIGILARNTEPRLAKYTRMISATPWRSSTSLSDKVEIAAVVEERCLAPPLARAVTMFATIWLACVFRLWRHPAIEGSG